MEALTKQEYKIAEAIALGFSEKEIASKFFISVKTVHTHTANLRRKINAKNIADVTRNFIFGLKNHFNLFEVVDLKTIASK